MKTVSVHSRVNKNHRTSGNPNNVIEYIEETERSLCTNRKWNVYRSTKSYWMNWIKKNFNSSHFSRFYIMPWQWNKPSRENFHSTSSIKPPTHHIWSLGTFAVPYSNSLISEQSWLNYLFETWYWIPFTSVTYRSDKLSANSFHSFNQTRNPFESQSCIILLSAAHTVVAHKRKWKVGFN